MLNWIKSLFKKEEVVEAAPEPEDNIWHPKYWLLGQPPKSRATGGPVMHNIGRDWSHILRPCDMKDCVRPSCATVLTTLKFDVDIPGATGNRLRGTSSLPTYQEYQFCDRCYKKHVAGKPGTAMVTLSVPIYDPDKNASTQKKLATKAPEPGTN